MIDVSGDFLTGVFDLFLISGGGGSTPTLDVSKRRMASTAIGLWLSRSCPVSTVLGPERPLMGGAIGYRHSSFPHDFLLRTSNLLPPPTVMLASVLATLPILDFQTVQAKLKKQQLLVDAHILRVQWGLPASSRD